jgi:dUTP pyrophosphatase
MKLKVYRVRKMARLPERAHDTDAGMDLFYCPEMLQMVSLKPGQTSLFETGLKIGVPPGHMLQVMNKSGIATKKQLVVGACVVDSGYSGEVFVNLHNIGNKEVYIHPGQKIAQAVLLPVLTPAIEEVPTDQVYDDETTRGGGGFGSTGDF